MEPPNLRIVDVYNPNLELRDNPKNNCLNCFFYTESGTGGYCSKYRYHVAQFHNEERVTGFITIGYATTATTEEEKVYDSPPLVCDYFLPKAAVPSPSGPLNPCGTCCYFMILLGAFLYKMYWGLFFAGIFIAYLFLKYKYNENAKEKQTAALIKHDRRINKLFESEITFSKKIVVESSSINMDQLDKILNMMDFPSLKYDEELIYVKWKYRFDFVRSLAQYVGTIEEKIKQKEFESIAKNKYNLLSDTVFEDESSKENEINQIIYCPNCGHEVQKGAKFCENCGSKLI
ncbi:MAG: zinc ribbon domain-containing protein [Promethearchaeota archaeon]